MMTGIQRAVDIVSPMMESKNFSSHEIPASQNERDMSDILDRVAGAIYDAHRPRHHADWAFISENIDQREAWRKIARAAIEAMRAPTYEMLNAEHKDRSDGAISLDDYSARACWESMIDAALK